MDVFTKKKRSEIMAKIGSKDTSPERLVFSYLRKNKIYFRKHYKNALGNPDVSVPSKKIAVFVDGDFWHGWHFAKWKRRIPKKYWQNKIQMNIDRDRRTFTRLRRTGWKVLRVWEHDLSVKKRKETLKKIVKFLTTK